MTNASTAFPGEPVLPAAARAAAIFLLVAASLLLTCVSLLARIHPLLPLPPYAEIAVSAYNTITHYPLRLFAASAEGARPDLPRIAGMQYVLFDALIFAAFLASNALAVRRIPLAFGWVNRLRAWLTGHSEAPSTDAELDPRHLLSPRYVFCLLLAGTIVFAIFSLKRAVAGAMDLFLAVYIVALLWTFYLQHFRFVSEGPATIILLPAALFAFAAAALLALTLLLALLEDFGLDLLWWLIAGQDSYTRFWTAMLPFIDLSAGLLVLVGAFSAAAVFGELRFLVRLSLCLVLVLATLVQGAFWS